MQVIPTHLDEDTVELNTFYTLEDGTVVFSCDVKYAKRGDLVWQLPDEAPRYKSSLWSCWSAGDFGPDVKTILVWCGSSVNNFNPFDYGMTLSPSKNPLNGPERLCDCGARIPACFADARHLCKVI